VRRKRKILSPGFQDPGKDLFAFLFLTTFIMVFVMLMAYEQKTKSVNKPPTPPSNSGGTITLPKGDIGLLTKEKGKIILAFGSRKFDPTDQIQLNTLITGPWIKEMEGKKRIYLKEAPNSNVLLSEYFSAFNEISGKGIEVVFGK